VSQFFDNGVDHAFFVVLNDVKGLKLETDEPFEPLNQFVDTGFVLARKFFDHDVPVLGFGLFIVLFRKFFDHDVPVLGFGLFIVLFRKFFDHDVPVDLLENGL